MNLRKIAIQNCEGINGFTESEFSKDTDITFNRGRQDRQINVEDTKYGIVIWLTHWCRPKQFHAADRVKIIFEENERDLYPVVMKDIAKNFDMIVSEFNMTQEEGHPNYLRGEITVKTYLNVFK